MKDERVFFKIHHTRVFLLYSFRAVLAQSALSTFSPLTTTGSSIWLPPRFCFCSSPMAREPPTVSCTLPRLGRKSDTDVVFAITSYYIHLPTRLDPFCL
jgi:hypothetical protein